MRTDFSIGIPWIGKMALEKYIENMQQKQLRNEHILKLAF